MIVSSARLRGSERKSSERWFAGDGGDGVVFGGAWGSLGFRGSSLLPVVAGSLGCAKEQGCNQQQHPKSQHADDGQIYSGL